MAAQEAHRLQAPIPAGTWAADRAHTSVEFRIRHLMLASVRGQFTDFDGSLDVGQDGGMVVSGVVRVASIDTHEPKRDAHLRSADFFDADTYPELRFTSTSVEPRGDAVYAIAGDLTIRDVTRSVELAATMFGPVHDAQGNERVGLEVRGEIDRTDFGLTWNAALETGGALVGDTVQIEIDVSAIRR